MRAAIAPIIVVTLLAARASAAGDTAVDLPYFTADPTGHHLRIGGKQFVILGGELGNSSASNVALAKPMFAKLAAMKLNTVLVPVSWELIEPAEGKWSFDLVGGLIREARRHKLHVVLLWFGSWKNGMSSYVPAWIKTDPQRFPRAEVKGGRRVEALSAFSPANLQADARAFAALMRYVRGVDSRDHTVLLVQVENEVAMIDEAADRSAAARAAFAAAVPKELVDYLQARSAVLAPELARAWTANGKRTSGSWEEVFGRGVATEELFMAWHYARYVSAVAQAGRAAYALPMFVNAALNRPGKQPGQYPSGGPLPHLYDVWRAGAPDLSLLAPDIYLPDFATWCDRYARQENPLFIPEARNDSEAGIRALYAIGRGAVGFSPFAIETTDDAAAAALTKAYGVLAELTPVLTDPRPKSMAGVLVDKDHPTQTFVFGETKLTVSHDYTFEWASPARHDPVWPGAGGLLVEIGPDEYIVAGNGIIVTFASVRPDVTVGIERVDEGAVTGGKFAAARRLNGDETHQGRQVRLPMGALGVQRLKIYRFK